MMSEERVVLYSCLDDGVFTTSDPELMVSMAPEGPVVIWVGEGSDVDCMIYRVPDSGAMTAANLSKSAKVLAIHTFDA